MSRADGGRIIHIRFFFIKVKINIVFTPYVKLKTKCFLKIILNN